MEEHDDIEGDADPKDQTYQTMDLFEIVEVQPVFGGLYQQ